MQKNAEHAAGTKNIMFFLIKFIILALFLVAFFFIPVGSKPLYDHLKAIGKTAPAQELKQDFVKNLIQLETWAKSHKALAGEIMPEQQKPAESCDAPLPAQKENNEDGGSSTPAPDMKSPASPEKPEKPADARKTDIRKAGVRKMDTRKTPAMRSPKPDGETP